MRYGKIALWLMLVLAIVGFTLAITRTAKAATDDSWTLVVPYLGDSNAYLVIVDKYTGDIVDPSTSNNATGIPESDTTWAEGAIATSDHGESNWHTFTVPALNKAYRYAGAIYSNGTPAKTDVPINNWKFLINPGTKSVCSDTNPVIDGKVRVLGP